MEAPQNKITKKYNIRRAWKVAVESKIITAMLNVSKADAQPVDL